MDGLRVAYAVKSDTCTKVIVLNVLTRSAAVASGPKTCDADNSSTGAGVREIAVAGARLAWIVNQGGNSESDDYLYTATLGAQRERLVASAFRSGDVDGVLAGAWIGHLVGAGDRMAVNRFTTDKAGTIIQASLQRLDAGLSTLALGSPSLYAVSLDLHRVAVLRTDHTLAIYETEARRQRQNVRPTTAPSAGRCSNFASPTAATLHSRRRRARSRASRSRRPASSTPTTRSRPSRRSVTSPSCRCARRPLSSADELLAR